MKSLHDLIADKLEANPLLLQLALKNIERWLDNGHTDRGRLEQWREMIQTAQVSQEKLDTLLAVLRDRSDQTQRLRDFAPFAGILSSSERRQAKSLCAYHF